MSEKSKDQKIPDDFVNSLHEHVVSNSINSIEKQIHDNFSKAFYELIDETVSSEKPNYKWIVELYIEIKHRLIRYLKKGSPTYKKLDEDFSVELFKQMIENDVFDAGSMLKLINITYDWIQNLQAPDRDDETDQSKNRVLSSGEKIVSTFIREVNHCIDNLDKDFIDYVKLSC